MPTLHVVIKGKVQGVFYRATAKEVADEIGITGWVKNTPEGNVEALVTGDEEQVQKFLSWCKQGPLLAKVSDVITAERPDESFLNFKIIREVS